MKVLDVGKTAVPGAASSSGAGPAPAKEKIEEASTAVYKWLKLKKSPARGLMQILSAGGCFYAAEVMERVARATVEHKPISEGDFVAAMVARTGEKDAPPEDDAMDMFGEANAAAAD